MSNDLATIKKGLPYGYEKRIAEEVGCSQGTVHNILNGKVNAIKSPNHTKVISAAVRIANENMDTMKALRETASELTNHDNGNKS